MVLHSDRKRIKNKNYSPFASGSGVRVHEKQQKSSSRTDPPPSKLGGVSYRNIIREDGKDE